MEGEKNLGRYSTNEVRWSTSVPRCTFVVVVFHRRVYSNVLPLSAYRKVRCSTIGLELSYVAYFAHFLFSVSEIVLWWPKIKYADVLEYISSMVGLLFRSCAALPHKFIWPSKVGHVLTQARLGDAGQGMRCLWGQFCVPSIVLEIHKSTPHFLTSCASWT